MSYAMGEALQAAVYQLLQSDPGVQAQLAGAVYDALPPGPLPSLYATLGEEDVRDRSDKTGAGALHDLDISVITAAPGFSEAKAAAVAVSDALLGADLVLSRGRVVGLWFLRARARRIDGGAQRRIDLRFRAQTEDI
ncbi:DUF3168 domain-containing protein [Oceaniglobus roseus]|uniref:DUF3168 domain-containing protein n=1 Tax=Oceaniglobus roseus TaxID=1737570 RepID=UPI000C7F565A|nr:DUF3168 domain-containing protein [Kandeliimicrobium roseum]